MCWKRTKKEKSEIEKYKEFEKWSICNEILYFITLITFLSSFLLIWILVFLALTQDFLFITLIVYFGSALVILLLQFNSSNLLGIRYKKYDNMKLLISYFIKLEKELDKKDNNTTITHLLFILRTFKEPNLHTVGIKQQIRNYFFRKGFSTKYMRKYKNTEETLIKKTLQKMADFITNSLLIEDEKEKKRILRLIIGSLETEDWLKIFNEIEKFNETNDINKIEIKFRPSIIQRIGKIINVIDAHPKLISLLIIVGSLLFFFFTGKPPTW